MNWGTDLSGEYKGFALGTAHELAHLSCKAQAFRTCADELPPIAQTAGNCIARVAPIALSAPNEQAHVALIAHPGKICADEPSSTAQDLKTCADELPSYSSSWENMCSSCSSRSSPVSYHRQELYSSS